MKQKKSTKTQPKRVTLGETQAAPTSFPEGNNKMPSGHTKMSTNYTIHSSALQQARKAKKPAPRTNSKDNLSQNRKLPLPNSKSTKKLKINLQPEHSVAPPEESYREYCLVDENFIPVVNADDKKHLQDILAQTATTSCEFNSHFRNAGHPAFPQLRKRAISSSRNSEEEPRPKAVQKIDASMSAIKIAKPEYTSIEISAVAESTDIGLQYSARPEQKPQEIVVMKEEVAAQVAESESLSDLLFKLQFSHLGDEKSFSSLTSNQKEHFTQLLQTIASKLKGKPQIKPITFPATDSQVLPSSTYSLPKHEEEPTRISSEQLERLVCLREYHQMNWIEVGTEQSEERVQTSLYAVMSFLCHLFCFVEMHYSEEFVYMVQKYYGHTYREKYRRITRRLPLEPDHKFKVIEQGIFAEFINESNAYENPAEIAHIKAIFDAFNEHLEEYRPFYSGNGEQFPWSLRMFVSMSQYSINEDSLQIIFMQSREKMAEWCTLLCGLIVEHDGKALLPDNPLELKHKERQEKLVKSWIKEDNFERDGIELYSTQALHDAAELIYQQLLIECAEELL